MPNLIKTQPIPHSSRLWSFPKLSPMFCTPKNHIQNLESIHKPFGSKQSKDLTQTIVFPPKICHGSQPNENLAFVTNLPKSLVPKSSILKGRCKKTKPKPNQLHLRSFPTPSSLGFKNVQKKGECLGYYHNLRCSGETWLSERWTSTEGRWSWSLRREAWVSGRWENKS